jgi:uncharacterized protein (TIGR00369 family)
MAENDVDPSDLLAAQIVLEAQPFSVFLGAIVTQFGHGISSIEVPLRQELLQQNGFMHGGVIAYALDNAVTFAAATVLGPTVLTSGIAVTYLRPARTSIEATATVVGSTRKQAVVRCEVTSIDSNGSRLLVASGQGTVSISE